MKSMKNNSRNWILLLAWICLITGVVVLFGFLFSVSDSGYSIFGKDGINFAVSGQFGDYFGGVVGTLFALAGTLFIILNFYEQKKQYRIEAFESKFYEMLSLHRKNVEDISFDCISGREAIMCLVEKYEDFFLMTKTAFDEITSDSFSSENTDDIRLYLVKNKEYTELMIHKLSYGFFLYSINSYLLTGDENCIDYKIYHRVKKSIIGKFLGENEGMSPVANESYNHVLSHYFRHLFNMVKLVSKQEILDEEEKYGYIKILRALLSDFEQILLYYNSLSEIGKKWIDPIGESDVMKMCFMARFRIIKNIPYYYKYQGIKPVTLFKTEIDSYKKRGIPFFEVDLTIDE